MYGRDYPDEKWATPYTFINAEHAQMVANALNTAFTNYVGADRYWTVVPANYKLQPGFEP